MNDHAFLHYFICDRVNGSLYALLNLMQDVDENEETRKKQFCIF